MEFEAFRLGGTYLLPANSTLIFKTPGCLVAWGPVRYHRTDRSLVGPSKYGELIHRSKLELGRIPAGPALPMTIHSNSWDQS